MRWAARIPVAIGVTAFLVIGSIAATQLPGRVLEFGFLATLGLSVIYGISASRMDGNGFSQSGNRGTISVEEALYSLSQIAEARDREFSGHSERVANNSAQIGKALGLSESQLESLFWVGMLHDIGKIGVPESILSKPGPLTEHEKTIMRTHSEFGAEMVTPFCGDNAQIVGGIKHHHERWDGDGYPNRLVGRQIPKIARIVAVADVFEALTSRRPYRSPLSTAQAAVYLEQEAGRHFDPDVVRAFITLLHQGGIQVQIAERVEASDVSGICSDLVGEHS